MADAAAVSIFAGFAALSSFAIIFGGFIADRLIGAERTVVSGGILMIAGSSVLAREATLIPAVSGAVSTPFVLALSLIAIGTGLLKCGATTMVGRLYSLDDPRRDVGFTIYYLGVNLGSGIAAIVCGYVGEQIGWGAGFGVAALGMLIGIATFLAGRRHYGPARDRDPKANMKESSAG